MSVRSATVTDLPVLKSLCDAFRTTRRLAADIPFDPDLFMTSLAAAIDDNDTLLLMLDDDQGFFLGALGVTPYSTVQIAHELLWYTRPEARGRGFSLVRAFVSWAQAKRAEFIFITLPEPRKAMERFGFTMADVQYLRRLS